jgi:hypothetical protein
MRRRLGLTVLAGLVLPLSLARAADAPVLIPTRDVAVTYRMDAGGRVLEQRMRWSVAARRMRIDPPTPGVFLLIDYATRRMDVVRDPDRSFVEMEAPTGLPGLGSPGTAAGESQVGRYVRGGADEVSGMACTDWTTRDAKGRAAEICVTADGVLLRVRLDGRVLAAAAQVAYGAQDPALFQLPQGYTRLTQSR